MLERRRRSPEIEHLVQAFVRRLTAAMESATSARAGVLSEEYLSSAAAPARPVEPRVLAAGEPASLNQAREPETVGPSAAVQTSPLPAPRVRRKAPRPEPATVAKITAAIDPDEQRRAAELARVRAILRPTAPVATVLPVVTPPPPRAAEEHDSLQALEDQIREQIPALAGLSQSRYTARIAVWVGRVRLHQIDPDAERTRIASRMLFEKLRSLAWSMEAGPIEALNTAWSTRNWERYIEENEAIAATPDASPPPTPEPEAELDVWATPSEAGTQA